MNKSLRLSETWFNRGLWLIAIIFAGFLIGFGSKIVGDLPKVEQQLSLEQFRDEPAYLAARQLRDAAQPSVDAANQKIELAQKQLAAAQAATLDAQASLENWLATRTASQQSSQNPALVERKQKIDHLVEAERKAQAFVSQQTAASQPFIAAQKAAYQKMQDIDALAMPAMQAENRRQELRVFLYRLALTLPLLIIAGYLFAKQRKCTYWPFVWGFILFSLFVFFVELVPYLPSYGGYVRYGVGIAVTVLVGRQLILALNAYLAKQKLIEALPDEQRHEELSLSYDTALQRMAKNVCPGCERPIDTANPERDFCAHCGIGLFKACTACNTRKNAFTKFCMRCGLAA